MTITESRIKEMNEAGYPVVIIHFRYLKSNGVLARTYNNSRSKKKYGAKPEYSPYGGLTVVQLGMFIESFRAECSKKDHFCFKDGTFLAVSRAYTFFKEQCVEKPQGVAMQQEVPESKSCCGGSCCNGIKEVDEGTFQTVYREATKFSIICVDPKTDEFIGYVPKTDPIIKFGHGSMIVPNAVSTYAPQDYTKEVTEAAEFDSKEEAEKYLDNTAEKVIKANYKLIGQVTVTEV